MNYYRFQVELDEEQMRELEELRTLGNLRTKKDLLDVAFSVLGTLARRSTRETSVAIVNEVNQSCERFVFPYLEAVARKKQAAQDGSSLPSGIHPMDENTHDAVTTAATKRHGTRNRSVPLPQTPTMAAPRTRPEGL